LHCPWRDNRGYILKRSTKGRGYREMEPFLEHKKRRTRTLNTSRPPR
jgi:hypothetical protein